MNQEQVVGLNIQVLGFVEKLWGRKMCAHGHEGPNIPTMLPDFPIVTG